MQFEFQVVDGPAAGRRFQIGSNSELTVGRTEVADQMIATDSIMSSQHFQLRTSDSTCQLEDLGSTNGTFVNGSRVNHATLNSGDMITAGHSTFEFRISQSSHTPQVVAKSDAVVDHTIAAVPSSAAEVHDESSEVRVGFDDRTIAIPCGELRVFGRTSKADVVVPDEMVSGVHFSLQSGSSSVTLTDLGSSNGTFFRGERIQHATLHHGDTFRAGRTEFSVVIASEQRTPHSSPAAVPSTATAARPETRDQAAADRSLDASPESIDPSSPTPASTPPASTPASTPNARDAAVSSTPEPMTSDSIPSGSASDVNPLPEDGRRPKVIRTASSILSKWPYQKGLTDSDGHVRAATLLAAVWSRQPWVLEQCRTAASEPTPDQIAELVVLAILGDEHDLSCFQQIVGLPQFGEKCFSLLGTYGHPQIVPLLLERIADGQSKSALFAARAFSKITGRQVYLAPSAETNSHTVDREVSGPAASLAKDIWNDLEPKLGQATRVYGGTIMDCLAPDTVLTQFDMASQLEMAIRGVFAGIQPATPQLLFRATDYLQGY